MKKLRILGIFLALLAVLAIAAPAFASATQTLNYNSVNGIEISAGTFDSVHNQTNGATFTAVALKTSLPISAGTLLASVNYIGQVRTIAPFSNTITGGNWTLKVTVGAKKGTIVGTVTDTGNSITWYYYKGSVTGKGYAYINLKVTGGTGDFTGVTGGTGIFTGWDVHQSGIYILGIQVPLLADGKLQLSLN